MQREGQMFITGSWAGSHVYGVCVKDVASSLYVRWPTLDHLLHTRTESHALFLIYLSMFPAYFKPQRSSSTTDVWEGLITLLGALTPARWRHPHTVPLPALIQPRKGRCMNQPCNRPKDKLTHWGHLYLKVSLKNKGETSSAEIRWTLLEY